MTAQTAIPHWIDNQAFVSKTTTTLHHPNSLDPVHEVCTASADDIDLAISSAQKAFPGWSSTTPQKRREILLKAATLLREQQADFVKAWQSEMDVHEGFAGFNAGTSAGMIEEIASNITTALQGDIPQAADSALDFSYILGPPGGHLRPAPLVHRGRSDYHGHPRASRRMSGAVPIQRSE